MSYGDRFEFNGEFEEKGGQIFVSGRGLYSSTFTKVHFLEGNGLASVPVKGAQGLILFPNGRPEEAYVVGLEHPGQRPSGMPQGSKAIYDASGNIIKLVGDGIVVDAGSHTITVTAGDWILNGNMTVNGNIQLNGNMTATGSVVDGDGDGGA